MTEMPKSMKMSEEMHKNITKVKGSLMEETGEDKTYEDALNELYQLWLLKKRFPKFVHINTNDDRVTLMDRTTEQSINVFLKTDQPPFCDLCQSNNCRHIQFTIELPEVQEAYRRKDLKLPET